jgi:acyl-CoA thioester hydrolase
MKPFKTVIEVRYRDTDSMGHISSPIYYDYLQTAYLSYMHSLLGIPKSDKLPHIMVKTSCDYLSQARYGDNLIIHSRVTRFGSKSFDMEHEMFLDGQTEQKVADARSTHVMYDYANAATYAIPAEFRSQVAEFQGE